MGSHPSDQSVAAPLKPLLSLRVEAEVARAFRIEAAARGLPQNELFEELWTLYQDTRRGAV
jgi:hypothetical protein